MDKKLGSTEDIVDYLKELEGTAEELLTNKSEIVQLDKQRNDNRMGIRHLIKTDEPKSWLVMGETFFRINTPDAKKMLDEDQKKLDTEIANLRQDMKKKMDKMRTLENLPALKGFYLKPLSTEELEIIRHTIG